MVGRVIPRWLGVGVALLGWVAGSAADERVDAVMEHVRYLSSLGSRVPGYPGEAEARAYVRRVLEASGYAPEAIREEFFECAVPVDEGALIEVEGISLPLNCLWPNLVRTPTVSPDGLRGRLVDVGQGDWVSYDGLQIEDAIVLVDFNSGRNWQKAAELGAAAAIFLEPGETDRREAELKSVDVPIDFPRFYAAAHEARRLRESASGAAAPQAVIKGRMTWRNAPTANLAVEIPGTNPDYAEQRIVVTGYLDSMSVVPASAPGASQALSAATLLELARGWRSEPPERSVIVLFTSGHHMALRGIGAWVQAHARQEEPFASRLEDPIEFTSVLGLDLSPGGRHLAVAAETWGRPNWANRGGLVNQIMSHESRRIEELSGELAAGGLLNDAVLNGVRPATGHDGFSVLGDWTAFDTDLVLCAGLRGVTLTTASDARPLADTPLDTFDRTFADDEAGSLVADVLHLVPRIVDDPVYAYTGPLTMLDSLYSLTVRAVTFDPRQSYIPDEPVPGAVMAARRRPLHLSGVRNSLYRVADEEGRATFHDLDRPWIVDCYGIDADTGRIETAPDLGVNGDEKFPRAYSFYQRWVERDYVLFRCEPVDVYGLVDPQFLRPFDRLVLVGRGEGIPQQYGFTFNHPQAAGFLVPEWADRIDCATVFLPSDWPFKIVLPQSAVRMGMLLLNGSESQLEGAGFRARTIRSLRTTDLRAARDVWMLNESRIRRQHGSGIRSAHIDETHARSREFLDRAEEAFEARSYSEGVQDAREALGLEGRIYGSVQQTSNDVVKGIILYMALLVPFAYAGERLLFGFSSINKRIAGVGGVFLGVFLLLRFIPHPAFELSNAPYIIFLAFATLVLSLLVISIILGRFNSEMRQISSTVVGVHGADVGRVSASATAFALGISNMKRRRVRTFLTSVTVVLLTFALMSFTSVKLFLRYNEIPRPNTPSYPGILVRSTIWHELHPVLLDRLQDEYRGRAQIAARAWWVLRDMNQGVAVPLWSGERSTYAEGIIGVTARESAVSGVDRCLRAGTWLTPGRQDECLLSDFHAQQLGIGEDDLGRAEVRCLGRSFRVVGILDHQKLDSFRDLDNEELMPLDMRPQAAESLQAQTEFEGQIGVGRRKHLDGRVTLWLPYDAVMQGAGTLRSVAIRLNEDVNPHEEAKVALARYALTLFVGGDGRVAAYSSVRGTGFGGMGGLAVPITLAGLIILNTMLGSVHERQREIGTYGAIGLAPVHIGSLFVAEAFVYAVLGAIMGYLLGQGLARIGALIPSMRQLNLNYSSTAVVLTTLIAMGVVLLSTLYPARQASRLSVPDVRRRWVLPSPEGSRWSFLFPFTVAEDDVIGLFAFLRDYFSAYTEASVGSFYTDGAHLDQLRDEGQRVILLQMHAWVAPFDLGVSQRVVLRAVPRGQFDLYNIRMELDRLSGEHNAWKMVNQRFIRILRKQFLIWRTVSPEVQTQYRDAGEALLSGDRRETA